MTMFTAEGSTIDKVFLIYNEFKSVLSQRVTARQLLPVGADMWTRPLSQQEKSEGDVAVDYIYEQPPSQIFGELLPRYVETQLFYALTGIDRQ
jgi:F-type H+-transporting ATPase subunit gamma